MTEDYEYYHVDPYDPNTDEITEELKRQAIDDYDCANETGKYEPTIQELFERMRDVITGKSDEWLIKACKRWILRSRELHIARKKRLGLL